MVFLNKVIFVTLLLAFAFSAVATPLIVSIPTNTISKVPPCAQQKYLLSLSDSDLFDEGVNINVGKCYIADSRNSNTTSCDYYVRVSGIANLSMSGLPGLYGTGCLFAPDLPKQMSNCFGTPNTYPIYDSTSTPICTKDHLKNGANMLRIGINNGFCGPLCDCTQKYTYLMMSDWDLFNAGLIGVGKCRINSGLGNSKLSCDYYAQVTGLPTTTPNGLPDLIGTGCVVAPTLPKAMSICWGGSNTYPNYNSTSTPICTNDYVKNSANMIRIGIKKGHCGVC